MKVLVLDPCWPQIAHLVSALHHAGDQVELASTRTPERGGLSRYCRQIPISRSGGRFDPAQLEAIIDGSDADVILCTAESILEVLWALPERSQERLWPRTTQSQRALLLDRRKMAVFCQEIGLEVPESMPIPGRHALAAAGDRLGWPLVLRGTRGLAGSQVMISADLAAAEAALSRLLDSSPGEPFAQAHVPGVRCLVGGLFEAGRPIQYFAQHTVECYPPPTGPSTRVCTSTDPLLVAPALHFFRKLEWSGLACVEFIRRPDGSVVFLECNPRPWAAITAAAVVGIDFFALFARWLRGERLDLPQVAYRPGKVINLFPAYISAQLESSSGWQAASAWRALSSLAVAPWRRPHLAWHFLHGLYWEWLARRRRGGRLS